MSEIQSENHRKTDIKSMDLAELKAFTDGLRAGDHSDIETGWNQKISVSSAGWKYDRERADAL